MLKIMLDPGHGQYGNRSPLDSSFYEGTNNYKFALVLKEALLAYEGVEVLMTRNNISEDPSLSDRGAMAVKNGCDVFLSLHSNASSAPSAYGVEGYYSISTPDARGLLQGLCNVTVNNLPGSKVRRVTTKVSDGQDYYGVLRASKGIKYSALIEMGFHTNPGELACIRLDEWHKVVAEQMAKTFSDFFGLKLKEVAPPTPVEPEEESALQVDFDELIARTKKIEEEVKDLARLLESYR